MAVVNVQQEKFQFKVKIEREPPEGQIVGLILENGLQVVMLKKKVTPVVAVDVWYMVGSKNEQIGKSGFAHLFEHMMFEGSENVKKAEHMKLINQVGGMVNGSTSQDRTNYWEVVPSNQLELALWLEADRMRSLNLSQTNFENQRATVQEERRLRIDNQPYMRVIYELKDEVAYKNFAYKHSVIGSMEDLNNATLDDVKNFHQIYYRPNNAFISIVGDFEILSVVEMIRRYFQNIPAGPTIPPVDLSEPTHQPTTKVSYHDPFAPFPALSISYHVPERKHRDFYAVELLEKIMFDGESSRLYSKLIEEKQLALHILGGADGKFGPGLFFIFAQLNPQRSLDDLHSLINDEFNRLIQEKVSETELRKAKNKIKADYISQQESVRTLADMLCFYGTVFNNPLQYLTDIELFESLSRDDLLNVAQNYFRSINQSVIEIFPKKV